MRSYLVLSLLLAACGTSSSTSTAAIADTVKLLRVFDGDSFEVDEPVREVRLLGLNAPERAECLGDEAASQLAALLSDTALTLEGPIGNDQFGRELRYARAGGADAGEAMIDLGLALATSDDHPRRQAYADAEAQAVEGELGMWASDACGSPSSAPLEITAVEFNAPGDDASNPNGEWITIRNEGSEPMVLRDWGIRDESSRHRYEFPDVTLGGGDSLTVFSGCGDDRPPTELYWCAEGAVWNNGGDTALLQDPNGRVVDRVIYGAKS